MVLKNCGLSCWCSRESLENEEHPSLGALFIRYRSRADLQEGQHELSVNMHCKNTFWFGVYLILLPLPSGFGQHLHHCLLLSPGMGTR